MNKNCPKCDVLHEKPGIYCSRSCANSRQFTDETNRKRSASNRLSSTLFWSTDPRAEIERQARRRRRKYHSCKGCGQVLEKKGKICIECRSKYQKPVTRSKRSIQKLNSNSELPAAISRIQIPEYGIKGKGSTIEREIERVRKIKEQAMLKNGGYRKGSGRGKKGWYKGIFCDSSWELAFILYCEIKGIDVYRNYQKFEYSYQGKTYKYLPDFIIEEKFIEIKGYLNERNLAKISQFPHDKYTLEVYTEKQLIPIIKLIVDRYGKDYIKLYEMAGSEHGAQADLKSVPPKG